MSGLDLTPIGGFDPTRYREVLRAAGERPSGIQDPMRVGETPARPEGPEGPGGAGDGFAGVLAQSLENVRALQDDARAKTRALALGEDVDLHDVMIAAGKSEVAFNLVLEVRNKLVDAWDKLSRSVM
jgi:flagellar hook-basal body complex protein FliE